MIVATNPTVNSPPNIKGDTSVIFQQNKQIFEIPQRHWNADSSNFSFKFHHEITQCFLICFLRAQDKPQTCEIKLQQQTMKFKQYDSVQIIH